MIIVTGATGLLGRAIVEQLVKRIPASEVGISVRNPEKAADLAALGVRVRRGDFADPASLPHAFEGATQVLIVSSNARAYGGDTLTQHDAAIAAAREAGARRIVYTSHMGASDVSAFSPMVDHFATETMLRESGVPWTALRHGFYAANGLALMGDAAATGLLAAPADGKVCWTAHADLAEAAAIILTQAPHEHGPTAPLTASRALDLADLAAIASDLSGRAVHREVLTDAQAREGFAARGFPEAVVGIMMGRYLASRQGEFARVDPTLERLLGRPAISMRQLIADKLR